MCKVLVTPYGESSFDRGSDLHTGSRTTPVYCVYCKADGLLGNQRFLFIFKCSSFFQRDENDDWLRIAVLADKEP